MIIPMPPGNTAAQVTRRVNVVDTTIPVITLIGDANVSHQVWVDYVDGGAEAIDSLDGNLTGSIEVLNGVNASVPGSYQVIYQVSDAEGNQAVEVIREVEVLNLDPTDLVLSGFTIEENLGAGTEIGTFSTIDPDDPDGNRTYSYAIVDGTDRSNFSLSSGAAGLIGCL